MKLVSVIIPVHNGEKFINRCVISALNQDYPNVEVIVVDDGSTDKTLSILKNFKDEKLTVLNQKKGGVSSARNFGLETMHGDFVTFLDADDLITSSHIRTMLKSWDENTDLIIENCQYSCKKSNKHSVLDWSSKETIKNTISNNKVFGYVWNRMYKKSLIENNHIFFNEQLSVMEDVEFNLQYNKYVHESKFLSKCTYIHTFNDQSVTNKSNHERCRFGKYEKNELCGYFAIYNVLLTDYTWLIEFENIWSIFMGALVWTSAKDVCKISKTKGLDRRQKLIEKLRKIVMMNKKYVYLDREIDLKHKLTFFLMTIYIELLKFL